MENLKIGSLFKPNPNEINKKLRKNYKYENALFHLKTAFKRKQHTDKQKLLFIQNVFSPHVPLHLLIIYLCVHLAVCVHTQTRINQHVAVFCLLLCLHYDAGSRACHMTSLSCPISGLEDLYVRLDILNSLIISPAAVIQL